MKVDTVRIAETQSMLATLAPAALLKKFGKSDVDDIFAEIDFRHGRRFCR